MSVKQQASFRTGLKSDLTTSSRKSDHNYVAIVICNNPKQYLFKSTNIFYKIKFMLLTVQEKI